MDRSNPPNYYECECRENQEEQMKRGPKPKFKEPFRAIFIIEKSWLKLIASITGNRSDYIQTAVKEKLQRDGLLEAPHENS